MSTTPSPTELTGSAIRTWKPASEAFVTSQESVIRYSPFRCLTISPALYSFSNEKRPTSDARLIASDREASIRGIRDEPGKCDQVFAVSVPHHLSRFVLVLEREAAYFGCKANCFRSGSQHPRHS